MRVVEYNIELNEYGNNILVKEKSCNYTALEKSYCFTSPDKIASFCKNYFRADKKAEEYLWLLALNTKNKLIGCFKVSHGTVNASLVGKREIFIRLLLCGAVNGIVVHNHPSGDPTPSKDDFTTTTALVEAGKLLNCQILDHIIIGKDSAYSICCNESFDIND